MREEDAILTKHQIETVRTTDPGLYLAIANGGLILNHYLRELDECMSRGYEWRVRAMRVRNASDALHKSHLRALEILGGPQHEQR